MKAKKMRANTWIYVTVDGRTRKICADQIRRVLVEATLRVQLAMEEYRKLLN